MRDKIVKIIMQYKEAIEAKLTELAALEIADEILELMEDTYRADLQHKKEILELLESLEKK